MLDRVAKAEFTYDARDLSRRACQNFSIVYRELVDWRGYARNHVRRLGPNYAEPDPNNRNRPAGWPRLLGLHGPVAYDREGNTGSWFCSDNGARGDDVVDLVVYLTGGASRRVAAEALADILDRIVTVRVA
jgi:hypothetical protein